MGLGLGMIKNIIEAYEGRISFTSKEGIGKYYSGKRRWSWTNNY